MCVAVCAVSQNDVNFRVRVRCEPSYIAVVRSKSISELAYSVDLPLYFNSSRTGEIYQFCLLACILYREQLLVCTPE